MSWSAPRAFQLAAQSRIQFGGIASFKPCVTGSPTARAIEAADATVAAAWDDRSPLTAALAKATAGQSARTVARHCQQVLAGIGFTTEHAFHRYLRRILVLDQLFGDTRALTHEIGTELLLTRQLPPLRSDIRTSRSVLSAGDGTDAISEARRRRA
jgi:alkylation response protein AidB-like acyl-CoA dehydrogenase